MPVSRKVLLIPGRKSKAKFELVFKAAGMKFKTYYLKIVLNSKVPQRNMISSLIFLVFELLTFELLNKSLGRSNVNLFPLFNHFMSLFKPTDLTGIANH